MIFRPSVHNRVCWLALAALVLALGAISSVSADERILDFHSVIAIQHDASVNVTETIKVRSEGDRITHGIYRDFPTNYPGSLGNSIAMGFTLVDAQRDGHGETSRLEYKSNGVRIYLGSANVKLQPGAHVYVLRYRATRALGFFRDHDELYWNVTGNGWGFPIDHASAQVLLPSPVPAKNLTTLAFTCPQGARGTDWRSKIDAPGKASFVTIAALPPKNGMTIVLSFPKGVVEDHQPYARRFDNGAVRGLNGGIQRIFALLIANGFEFKFAEFAPVEDDSCVARKVGGLA